MFCTEYYNLQTEQVLFIMTRHWTSWEIKFIRLFPLPLACYLFQDSPVTHIMLNSGDSWHLIITTLVMPSAPGRCCCLLRVGGKSKDTALVMSSEKIPWIMYGLIVPQYLPPIQNTTTGPGLTAVTKLSLLSPHFSPSATWRTFICSVLTFLETSWTASSSNAFTPFNLDETICCNCL